ncbi:MAG: hypothetical protein IT531_15110 [Burkholderiales bacterium]|nr:hypothetical protein [Burkholderiales bacterium]
MKIIRKLSYTVITALGLGFGGSQLALATDAGGSTTNGQVDAAATSDYGSSMTSQSETTLNGTTLSIEDPTLVFSDGDWYAYADGQWYAMEHGEWYALTDVSYDAASMSGYDDGSGSFYIYALDDGEIYDMDDGQWYATADGVDWYALSEDVSYDFASLSGDDADINPSYVYTTDDGGLYTMEGGQLYVWVPVSLLESRALYY